MSLKRLLPILATVALACGSDTPYEPEGADRPVVLQFYGPPGNVNPGDSVMFNFVVRDSTLGKKLLTLRFDGALTRVYLFEFEMDEYLWAGYVWVILPAEAELRSAVATLIFSNEAGLSHEKTFSIMIWDNRRPEATLALGGLRSDGTIGTGQPLVPDPLRVGAAARHEVIVSSERLTADPDLRRRLGEAGRERARHEFSEERSLDAWQELLRECVEEAGR